MSEGNAWGTPAPGSGQTHALHAPRSFDARELFVESCLGQAAVLPCGRTNLLRHTGQHRTGASGESSEGPERSGGRAQEIARSVAQVTYLGAASDSWFKHGDGKISCAERWRQLTAQDLVEVNGVLPKEEPDQDEAEAEVEYRTGPGGLVERIVKGPPAGTDRKS